MKQPLVAATFRLSPNITGEVLELGNKVALASITRSHYPLASHFQPDTTCSIPFH